MNAAHRPVSTARRISLRQRCQPLLPRGGAELDAALLALHASEEIKEVWEATRRVVHAALPLHFICMCLRPFALMPSTVFRESAPFASEEEFRLFQQFNPLQSSTASNSGIALSRLSDVVNDRELLNSEFYRRFMLPHDDRYFACLNFWHSGVFQGMIGFHRTSADHDFTDAELATLRQLHPHFDTVLQRILSLHRERAVRLSLEKLLVNLPIATVLLDWDLRVVSRNRSAVDLCALWNLGPSRAMAEKYGEQFHLPRAIEEYCTEFKARWVPAHHRSCPLTSEKGGYVDHPDTPRVRASVSLLQLDAAPLSMPMFLIRLEDNRAAPPSVHDRVDNSQSALGRLTLREREVALLVGRGLSNEEVAGQLGKSTLTVKTQLRSIYQKLDVPGRGRLIALMR